MPLPKITRGPYEVTVNLEYPTTETLDIPAEWVKIKCFKCSMPILIDKSAGRIHHRQPFCSWWKTLWLNKPRMAEVVRRFYEYNTKDLEKLGALIQWNG